MYKIEKQFKDINQLINIFKWFLITLLCVVTFTELSKHSVCWSILCASNFFNHVATITKNAIPLLAALLATLVADRHIVFTSKNRGYDQVLETAQITHTYIAITKDLKNKVSFLRKMYLEDGHYIHTFTTIIQSIENRYESLYDKEAYKYLDRITVDKINSMSANIFGLISIIESMKEMPNAKSNLPFSALPNVPIAFNNLVETIDSLLQDLYDIRDKVDKD
jgi:hypothetical protein